MITLTSPGPNEDAGGLLNFYIERGKRRIALDPANGPFVFHTFCELLDGTVITAHEKLPTIAGAGAVREARRGRMPHCMATSVDLFYTNGSSCRISGLMLDFNMSSGYREASTLIRHGRSAGTHYRLDNNHYDYLTIIDSYEGVRNRDNSQPGQVIDSWAIVFSQFHEDGINNHSVKNCYHFARGTVFVSGGTGPGINGLDIEDNYSTYGNPEGITLVSRYGVSGVQDSPGDTATLQNMNIRRNYIWDFSGLAIHIGQDNIIGNENLLEVNLENVIVENNWITLNSFREDYFPACVTIKAGEAATSEMRNVIVRNNTFDVSRQNANEVYPRFIVGRASETSPFSELRHYGNVTTGSGINVFQNIENVYTEAL